MLLIFLLLLSYAQTVGSPPQRADTAKAIPIRLLKVDKDGDTVPDMLGQTVTIAGRAANGSHTLSSRYFKVYLQDSTGGMQVFNFDLDKEVRAGDSLRVAGTLAIYRGQAQISEPQVEIIPAPRRVPRPRALHLTAENVDSYEGDLITITGHVLSKYSNDGGNMMDVIQDHSSLPLTVFVSHDSGNKFDFDYFSQGDHIRITGFLGQFDFEKPFDEFYQIYPRSQADIHALGLSNILFRYLVFATLFVLFLFLVWVFLLRKKVSRQAKDLRRREQQYYSLFKQSPAGILLFDPHLVISDCNQNLAHLLGTTQDELLGLNMNDLQDEGPIEAMQTALKGENGTFEGPYRSTLSGNSIYVSMNTTPYYDSDNSIAGGIAIVEDITERMNVQKELQRLNQQLKASLREKDVLLAEIHHRVKNNLAVITGLLSLQSDSIMDRDARQVFLESESRVHTMAIIHEMLYQEKSFAEIDFPAYLERLSSFISQNYQPEDKMIHLEMDTDPIKLEMESAIPCALLVNELLSNAYKYAFEDRDGGNITIRLKRQEALLVLSVEDDGNGLPENFELAKLESLGMLLVQQLTLQLEGELDIDSDHGTTFRITFPEPAHQVLSPSAG